MHELSTLKQVVLRNMIKPRSTSNCPISFHANVQLKTKWFKSSLMNDHCFQLLTHNVDLSTSNQICFVAHHNHGLVVHAIGSPKILQNFLGLAKGLVVDNAENHHHRIRNISGQCILNLRRNRAIISFYDRGFTVCPFYRMPNDSLVCPHITLGMISWLLIDEHLIATLHAILFWCTWLSQGKGKQARHEST